MRERDEWRARVVGSGRPADGQLDHQSASSRYPDLPKDRVDSLGDFACDCILWTTGINQPNAHRIRFGQSQKPGPNPFVKFELFTFETIGPANIAARALTRPLKADINGAVQNKSETRHQTIGRQLVELGEEPQIKS